MIFWPKIITLPQKTLKPKSPLGNLVENDLPLEPIEINVGHMCAYLFGETIGQQDEAWCQGQIIGKQPPALTGWICIVDVVILRESLDNPVVIRLAVNADNIDAPFKSTIIFKPIFGYRDYFYGKPKSSHHYRAF